MIFYSSLSAVGIDINTNSIRIVELEKKEKVINLKNYGEYQLSDYEKEVFKNSINFQNISGVSEILKRVIKEIRIKTKNAAFSLPFSSGFLTTMEIPFLDDMEEITGAIRFQVNQYIPVPLEEVVLDWNIIEKDKERNKIKIILVAVSKEVVERYMKIAESLGFSLGSLELENFALLRALSRGNEESLMIINIGNEISYIIIAEKGFVCASYDLNFSISLLIKNISTGLNISPKRAKEFLKKRGIGTENLIASSTIFSIIDKLIFTIKRIEKNYLSQSPQKKIQEVILCGKEINLLGLSDYLFPKIEKKIILADPFFKIKFPFTLKDVLKEIGPSFSVAVGLALGVFEKRVKSKKDQ